MPEKPQEVKATKLPPGPERPELHFDTSQFAPEMLPLNKYRPDVAHFADGLHAFTPPNGNAVLVETIRRRIESGEDIFLPAAIRRAAEIGELWAKAVNARSLLMLPPRLLEAFLWFYWGEFSHDQIASEMNISERASRQFLLRAKKKLSNNGAGVDKK